MVVLIKDGDFVDERGRILNLRGVNLGGSSKLPTNADASNDWYSDAASAKTASFVGRPFPLLDAPEHFGRLRACGFTFLRFVITWEAIEHAGPGVYDVDYLIYVREVLDVARAYGMYIYLDPHQDVWSRWTGGSGAPLWTLEMVGFDIENFATCEAVIAHRTFGQGNSTIERMKSSSSNNSSSSSSSSSSSPPPILPKMIWPTNTFKLACATMFTLFWAGETFAPQFMVENDTISVDGDDDMDNNDKTNKKKKKIKINIQKYLQTHYINAMAELLKHLAGLDNIVGIGTMNEPSSGFINIANLSLGYAQAPSSPDSSEHGIELRLGMHPTPFEAMCLGEGYVQTVGEWSNGFYQHVLNKPTNYVTVDPKGKKVWKNIGGCVWKQAGLWHINPETSLPELLQPTYFAGYNFGQDFYLPFAREYATVLRNVWDVEKSKNSVNNNVMKEDDGSTELLLSSSMDGGGVGVIASTITTTTTTKTTTQQQQQQPLLIFVELPPLEFTTTPFPNIPASFDSGGLTNAVNATHWYDGMTLFTQTWKSYLSVDVRTRRPLLGYRNIFNAHVSQLAHIKQLGVERMDNAPTLIGECGIPYNMNNGASYNDVGRQGRGEEAFGQQLAAMNHTISCLEENLLSFTLWCYTSDNTNEDGDLWNREDLSLYCKDQRQKGLDMNDPLYIYDGLRAPRAFARPYARCMTSKPLVNKFDMWNSIFEYRGVDHLLPGMTELDTEIFVPKLWCSKAVDMKITASEGGRYESEEHDHYFIVKYFYSGLNGAHWIKIQGPPHVSGSSFKICGAVR